MLFFSLYRYIRAAFYANCLTTLIAIWVEAGLNWSLKRWSGSKRVLWFKSTTSRLLIGSSGRWRERQFLAFKHYCMNVFRMENKTSTKQLKFHFHWFHFPFAQLYFNVCSIFPITELFLLMNDYRFENKILELLVFSQVGSNIENLSGSPVLPCFFFDFFSNELKCKSFRKWPN